MTHDQWRYNQSGANLGTSSRERGLRRWRVGLRRRAILSDGVCYCPWPKNTELNLNSMAWPPNTITYYFRTTFDFNGDVETAGLKLKAILDDGAVVYLNGAEVFRQKMLPGAVNFDTLASPAVGNPVVTGPFSLSTANLRLGENTLAVEVHQQNAGSTDVVFGAELILVEPIVNPTGSPPPVSHQRSRRG